MKEKRRIVKHDRALRVLEDRAEFIRQQSPRAALRSLDAAEETFRRLVISPGIGPRYDPDLHALADLRFFPIGPFKNDLIFYRPLPNGIEVLRILHGSQDIHRILADDFGLGGGPGEGEGRQR